MTYEEKMLAIFSRHRGETLSPALVAGLQETCEREVWAHLPESVLRKWKLKLAVDRNGGLELRPHQLQPGGAEELEAALKAEFHERKQPDPPQGGIASFGINFTGNFGPASSSPVKHADARETNQTAVTPKTETTGAGAEIAACAAELGISLPPNSSLLGPFLEALELAMLYKKRAEVAEALLGNVHK